MFGNLTVEQFCAQLIAKWKPSCKIKNCPCHIYLPLVNEDDFFCLDQRGRVLEVSRILKSILTIRETNKNMKQKDRKFPKKWVDQNLLRTLHKIDPTKKNVTLSFEETHEDLLMKLGYIEANRVVDVQERFQEWYEEQDLLVKLGKIDPNTVVYV